MSCCSCAVRSPQYPSCQEALASFLGGFDFPLSAGQVVAVLTFPGSSFVSPPNPYLSGVGDLVAWLNSTVIGAMLAAEIEVSGDFAVLDGTRLRTPQVEGGCPVVMMRGRLLSDG